MIRIGNTCISSTMILMIIALVLIATMAIASIMNSNSIKETPIDAIPQDSSIWIPTEDDIKYQDSMWTIIKQTQNEVDTIKKSIDHILYKLERIEYKDGTWDSIRIPVTK
jgi:methionine-rich copper-binding protein CopC